MCVCVCMLLHQGADDSREMENGHEAKSAVILWKIAKQLFEIYVEFPWQPDLNW